MNPKHLYKGDFNYYGEIHTLYRYATSESHAFVLMCHTLAERLKVSCGIIHHFFNGSAKYEIVKEEK